MLLTEVSQVRVLFLFAKTLIYKAFSILFNDIRLCGTPETVAAEPFSFSPITPFNGGKSFNKRSVPCKFGIKIGLCFCFSIALQLVSLCFGRCVAAVNWLTDLRSRCEMKQVR